MSLTPILLSNGSVTSDTAYWQDIWLGSHKTVIYCVTDPVYSGGHIYVGSRGLLILTFYEPRSKHDMEVQMLSQEKKVVCSKQDALMASVAEYSEAVACGAMTDAESDHGLLQINSGLKSPNATNHTVV